LEDDLAIKLVSSPYFLATKIEAFTGRGGGDYQASHDLEDIITLLDGRPEIVAEIGAAPRDLKECPSQNKHSDWHLDHWAEEFERRQDNSYDSVKFVTLHFPSLASPAPSIAWRIEAA